MPSQTPHTPLLPSVADAAPTASGLSTAPGAPGAPATPATPGLVPEYIRALLASEKLGRQVQYHTVLEACPATYADPRKAWPSAVQGVLDAVGIPRLYSHQAQAVDHIRAGRHVVAATPTASGKSLIYNLPVIERFLQHADSTALYLFPLKALAQDQLQALHELTAHWPQDARPRTAIYDGDTTAHFRKKIRENPPHILITNPEMLHLGILPFHAQWATFLANLSTVVVDEVHSYRGVLGSHMAQLFQRLTRISRLYGAVPSFVCCSATIGNPQELVGKLTGARAELVSQSGAPQGERHFLFINPEDSPASTAIQLLRAALARNMRTIVYTQSRRMTELISIWASRQSGSYAGRISAYRAGFLPEERRRVEARMASGELLAVISTSALELGIDIGSLDLCILVGYPGTVMSTLQRGGRVGRAGQESAVVLIAQEDALDQYIVRNAAGFFSWPAESAVVNPENPVIMTRHLECAAAESALRPLGADAVWLGSEAARDGMARLEEQGLLLRSEDGQSLHAARKRPQRHVDLRGAGGTVTLQDQNGVCIGTVDGVRAVKEAHQGAVYLHRGQSYIVERLDLPGANAVLTPGSPAYYTRARGNKQTEILSADLMDTVGGSHVCFGRLRVTEHVTGYEKRASHDGRMLGVMPLDMPPLVFETEGIWLTVPPGVVQAAEEAFMHFMGGIHAVEHAAIGILPLLVMADRNDFGGISTPMHAQLNSPAVFIYDALPGGAGLARHAFHQARRLLERTYDVIAMCPCETGCPACVHSPKCGSGNRPIDKEAARFVLEHLLAGPPPGPLRLSINETVPAPAPPLIPGGGCVLAAPSIKEQAMNQTKRACHPGSDARCLHAAGASGSAGSGYSLENAPAEPGCRPDAAAPARQPGSAGPAATPARYGVLDVETRYSADEVGGWHRANKMGVSVAVLYDSGQDDFTAYEQHEIPLLAERLAGLDLVVGFNIVRFDYTVLSPHAPGVDFRAFPTLDMLMKVHERLSYRLSLDTLAQATLGAKKSADGLMALRWWKEGRLDTIREYCQQDVALTRDLYLFGREHGHLLFVNKAGQKVRVPVAW